MLLYIIFVTSVIGHNLLSVTLASLAMFSVDSAGDRDQRDIEAVGACKDLSKDRLVAALDD